MVVWIVPVPETLINSEIRFNCKKKKIEFSLDKCHLELPGMVKLIPFGSGGTNLCENKDS